MDVAGLAEAHLAAQHGRAAKLQLARFQYDSFMQRLTLVLVVFAEKIRSKTASRGICMVRPISWR